ncbi:adenylyltransferase and sulfurtransferase MOCS3 [Danaus plexippus]|uniref:adenylyltransferase and sulfurtransferase MOCS3 n=1 Tax=Danaus plexippus TaxID=13037 RepID=UPI002AB1A04A|nr:adenylyltransferase and sulfurtransferase MOCS3 [Danaus plexippus]
MDLIKNLEHEILELREKLKIKEEELREAKRNINFTDKSDDDVVGTKSNISIGKLPKWAIERYSRQILLPDIGVSGQERLMSSRVLIVGAGGLGCPASIYLAGAGIGEIGIVDYDTVDITNIHRQILHTEGDRCRNKAVSAADSLKRMNSNIKVTPYTIEFKPENAVQIASNYDLIVDCTDNVPTRYMLSDLSVITKVPLISGSALKMEGQLTVYGYRRSRNEKSSGPCYRCLFPTPPPAAAVGSCSANGVAGPVPGAIGALQALEAIKLLVGRDREDLLVGRMLILDGEDTTFRTVKLRPKNPKCESCSDQPKIKQLTNYEVLCKMQSKEKDLELDILPKSHRISATELSNSLVEQRHLLIDVRSEAEYSMCHLEDSVNYPLEQLHGERFDVLVENIKNNENVIFVCRRGNDSQIAADMVLKAFPDAKVKDLSGGLHAWAEQVDREFPVY